MPTPPMPSTTPSPTPRPRREPAAPGPALGLRALHDLHLRHYLDYAALLLPPADAPLAVRDAFEDLSRHWLDALATTSPAACAWQAVRRRVRALAGPRPFGPVAHLTATQQDVLLLHLVLHLSAADIAALIGTEPAAVHVQLRALAADRPRTGTDEQ
ncbi:sigma factor-like helix-turn-helix DNA-binding protein [Kitasatospora xanthocidica]|uniref:sigma factor-like helix-turn-helix DNA-binding protein n=1 Tax=Kitasatospora xanthocidica TaxID=83382 RepID=UPI00167A77F0|nr:sigma factor-like helix-turn-helix DNA-binding protein [Kitasatospora xanthocidica]